MKKIFIYGSCVTRDPFLDNRRSDLDVVEYIARYSLARLPFPGIASPAEFRKLSPFQKKCVTRDFNNDLVAALQEADFDYLVLDFIDERHGLVEYRDGVFVTNSDEVRIEGLSPKGARTVTGSDDRFYTLWEEGLKMLLETVPVDKILINRVAWATYTDSGRHINEVNAGSTPSRLKYGTELMKRLYGIAERYISRQNFIEYPEGIFLVDERHQWGPAPFHYVKEVYDHLICELLKRA